MADQAGGVVAVGVALVAAVPVVEVVFGGVADEGAVACVIAVFVSEDRPQRSVLVKLVAGLGAAVYVLAAPTFPARNFDGIRGDANRGAYVARLAGCIACHTNTADGGAFMAGGPPIKTPFGTFYAPNVTPDPEDGIGGWTLSDFAKALAHGHFSFRLE